MVCDTSEGIGGFAMRTKDSVYLVDNGAYEQKSAGKTLTTNREREKQKEQLDTDRHVQNIEGEHWRRMANSTEEYEKLPIVARQH